MLEWSKPERWANPSAKHHSGKLAAKAIEQARIDVAQLIDASSEEEIVFCSGATEALNLGLQGLVRLLHASETSTLVAGFPDEHPAVGQCLVALKKQAYLQTNIEIQPQISDSNPIKLPENDPRLLVLCRMYAQNETGKIYDLLEVRRKNLRNGDWLFSDLSQAVGKIPVSVQQLDIQMGGFSGHKFGGPAGTGVLYLSRKKTRLNLQPITFGGGQEHEFRPGSLNLPGIVGLGVAAKIAKRELNIWQSTVLKIRETFETRIHELVPEVKIISENEQRLPNTSMIILPPEAADKMKQKLPGLCVTQGSACASASGKSSHVLAALGITKQGISNAYRFSFGRTNTQSEVLECLNMAFG